MTEFRPYPKTPRLFRDMVVTEKIDGTNAAIGVTAAGAVYAQSRSRVITPDVDNFGFAQWVSDNAETLAADLGEGLHFGEWWGQGIQRGYGLTEKRFSLFNVKRWGDVQFATPRLGIVPVLYEGPFDPDVVARLVAALDIDGSCAIEGAVAEGVIVFHVAANQVFKVTCKNDATPKALAS
jgi:hypothetical protein